MRGARILLALVLVLALGVAAVPPWARAGLVSRLARFAALKAGRVLVRERRACAADSAFAVPRARPPRRPPW